MIDLKTLGEIAIAVIVVLGIIQGFRVTSRKSENGGASKTQSAPPASTSSTTTDSEQKG